MQGIESTHLSLHCLRPLFGIWGKDCGGLVVLVQNLGILQRFPIKFSRYGLSVVEFDGWVGSVNQRRQLAHVEMNCINYNEGDAPPLA